MSLPVSMEDTELFPNCKLLNAEPSGTRINLEVFEQMHKSLPRLWWSRLVISVRGYVVNYVGSDDETLFHVDDAFIAIHRFLAEEKSDANAAKQFILDLDSIHGFPNISKVLVGLCTANASNKNIFTESQISTSLQRIFGAPNSITYRLANGQKFAYFVFLNILGILQQRWAAEREKKKGIRFETDPEWQPDDRVVLFQEFYKGNRTWVLLDFDRYILQQWKPQGSNIIFGDRFVEKKKLAGYELCSNCGMVEQQKGQFPKKENYAFCSPECLDAFAKEHSK
ncbi:unnamed protein product, partial [Mesorhabditis spiculigera]